VTQLAQDNLLIVAFEALKSVTAEHPTRELLLRLIASRSAWRSVHRLWNHLVATDASWGTLLQIRIEKGEGHFHKLLKEVYELTPGVSSAINLELEREAAFGAPVHIGAPFCL
jgi:hypothetical protein